MKKRRLDGISRLLLNSIDCAQKSAKPRRFPGPGVCVCGGGGGASFWRDRPYARVGSVVADALLAGLDETNFRFFLSNSEPSYFITVLNRTALQRQCRTSAVVGIRPTEIDHRRARATKRKKWVPLL